MEIDEDEGILATEDELRKIGWLTEFVSARHLYNPERLKTAKFFKEMHHELAAIGFPSADLSELLPLLIQQGELRAEHDKNRLRHQAAIRKLRLEEAREAVHDIRIACEVFDRLYEREETLLGMRVPSEEEVLTEERIQARRLRNLEAIWEIVKGDVDLFGCMFNDELGEADIGCIDELSTYVGLANCLAECAYKEKDPETSKWIQEQLLKQLPSDTNLEQMAKIIKLLVERSELDIRLLMLERK